MRFRSHGDVFYHFWADGLPASVHPPLMVPGLIGLVVTIAAVILGAAQEFRRADITV